MTIERVQVGDKIVLRLAGRMDADNANKLEPECDACIAAGFTRLVIDLGDLAYISSMGLRSFVSVAKKLKDKGGELRVCRLTGLVRQVFEITRLTQLFPLHDSVESALLER
jgi:anti-anti-sigma factor